MDSKECGFASRPPKTVTECYAVSRLSLKLLELGNDIKKYGKILCYCVIAFGVINALISAGVIEVFSYEDAMMETGFVMFLITLVTWGIYAFFVFLGYEILSMLLSAVATITQNSYVSANVALYEAFAKGTDESSVNYNPNKQADASAEWVCKKCGTKNSPGVQMCKGCGSYK